MSISRVFFKSFFFFFGPCDPICFPQVHSKNGILDFNPTEMAELPSTEPFNPCLPLGNMNPQEVHRKYASSPLFSRHIKLGRGLIHTHSRNWFGLSIYKKPIVCRLLYHRCSKRKWDIKFLNLKIQNKSKDVGVQRLASENSSGARMHWVENKPF